MIMFSAILKATEMKLHYKDLYKRPDHCLLIQYVTIKTSVRLTTALSYLFSQALVGDSF